MNKYMFRAILASFLLGILPLAATAQDQPAAEKIQIRGTVVDAATGKPIDAATIRMRDIAVFTHEDGAFTLKIADPSTVMEVTAPGYARRDIEWRGRSEIRIALSSEHFSTPVGDRPKVDPADKLMINEGTSHNTLEDIELVTPQQSVERVMQERLGNVRIVSRSGQDGIGSAMFIRGLNSLNANSQPLIVLDGIIFENYNDMESTHVGFFANYLEHIDLKDVENITVIKDASSIYGAKAANGAILIETVRGHDMVTRIEANAAFGQTLKPSTIPMLDGEQSRILASEIYKGSGNSAATVDEMAYFNDDEDYLYYPQYHNSTDWTDWVYRNGINQSYSARATGGDAVGMYALSVGYTTNKGVVEGNDMNHINFRFNSDISVAKTFKMGVDFSLSSIQYNLTDDGYTTTSSPVYLAAVKSPLFHPYTYARLSDENGERPLTTNLEDYDVLGINNPVSILQGGSQLTKETHFVASAKPVWDINEHWKLSGLAGYGLNKLYESYYYPTAGVMSEYRYNDAGYIEVYQNEVKSQNLRDIRVNMEARLSYNKAFGGHNLNVLGGFRFLNESRVYDLVGGYNSGEGTDVTVSKSLYYKYLSGENRNVRTISYFVNADWNYLKKYYLTATLDTDASSRFGRNISSGALHMFGVSWGLFPSLSGAWLASAEDFMADVDLVDRLKLRASVGLTGNDDIEDYVAYTYFKAQNYLDKSVGLVLGNLGSGDLKWESVSKANVGVDASLLDSRLSFSADVFRHHTSDMLVQKNLPAISGFEYYWANDGDLVNTGYEVALNARLVNAPKFRWEATVAAAHYRNRVTHLADGQFTTQAYDAEILTAEGQPLGVFYGYKTKGVYASDAEASVAYKGSDYYYNRNDNTSLSAFTGGDVIFVDKDGNGIIEEADKQVIGDPNPDLTGMFSSTVSYKGLSLSAIFNYSLGNDVYNYARRQLESMDGLENQSVAALNRWRSDGQVTDMPKAVYGDPMGNARFSDRWIEDGSYLRLRTVRLSWDVPFKIPYLNALTVWGAANNLCLWTRYLGQDPETSVSNSTLYQGIDTGLLPQCTSFTVGLKMNL